MPGGNACQEQIPPEVYGEGEVRYGSRMLRWEAVALPVDPLSVIAKKVVMIAPSEKSILDRAMVAKYAMDL